jgi:hypothetical protein
VNSLRGPAILQIAAWGRAAIGKLLREFFGEIFLGEKFGDGFKDSTRNSRRELSGK